MRLGLICRSGMSCNLSVCSDQLTSLYVLIKQNFRYSENKTRWFCLFKDGSDKQNHPFPTSE